MKRVMLGVVLALVGVSAHAESATPLALYHDLAGLWAGRQENVRLVYSVQAGTVRIEGESCAANPRGPESCLPIDQGYLVNDSQLVRVNSNFAVRPVEIVEMTKTKIVRRESSADMRGRVAVTTERLTNGGHTLEYTIEVLQNGRSDKHHFTLDRVTKEGVLY